MKRFAVLALALVAACDQPKPQPVSTLADKAVVKESARPTRYGMVTGIKPEKLDHYKQLHANPWPQVIKKLADCNIQNYSIYLQKIEQRYWLFSYFEYTGNNFDADMQKMAADTTTQRWWRETDPCQLPLPEAIEKKQVWTSMQEVFHCN